MTNTSQVSVNVPGSNIANVDYEASGILSTTAPTLNLSETVVEAPLMSNAPLVINLHVPTESPNSPSLPVKEELNFPILRDVSLLPVESHFYTSRIIWTKMIKHHRIKEKQQQHQQLFVATTLSREFGLPRVHHATALSLQENSHKLSYSFALPHNSKRKPPNRRRSSKWDEATLAKNRSRLPKLFWWRPFAKSQRPGCNADAHGLKAQLSN